MNPLICSPSPRDILDVQEAMDKVVCDKLVAKYFPEKEAYDRLRERFLASDKYTHMVICPDDLMVTNKDFQRLKQDVILTDYPVLAGLCNLYYSDLIAPPLAQAKRYGCTFRLNTQKWLTDEDIVEHYKETKSHFFKVEHESFACSFIRRDVVEQIKFHGQPIGAFDAAFSADCASSGIPIHVDILVRMVHLAYRLGEGKYENWGLGPAHIRVFQNPNDNSEKYKFQQGYATMWDNGSLRKEEEFG